MTWPHLQPVGLSVVDELDVLPERADLFDETDRSAPGAVFKLREATRVTDDEVRARMVGRTRGQGIPYWGEGEGGALRGGVNISRVRDVWHAPAFGAVIDGEGRVYRSSVQEALYVTPSLNGLPGTRMDEAGPVFQAGPKAPHLKRAGVFMAWGGLHNYGHFLLDCLPALWSLREVDGTGRYPLIAPPLTAWQRDLVGLVTPAPVREIAAPLVRVDQVLFSSCMDHFLHCPNHPLPALSDHVRSAVGAGLGHKKIYVSRRRDTKRVLVNELELERSLEALGFHVCEPADMTARDQVRLFADAEVIVSPTGAALANVIFAPSGAKVFEIQPSNFTGVWVRNICMLREQNWYGFFSPSPIASEAVMIEGNVHENIHFAWEVDIPALVDFVSANLG